MINPVNTQSNGTLIRVEKKTNEIKELFPLGLSRKHGLNPYKLEGKTEGLVIRRKTRVLVGSIPTPSTELDTLPNTV